MKPEDPSRPEESSEFRFDRSDLEDREVQKLHAQHQREQGEPHEGQAPLPLFMLLLIMALCSWGGFEFASKSAGFRWDVFDPNFDPMASAPGAPATFDPMARGKRVFNNCVACHQTTGAGVPGVYPPLAGSDWVGKSPEVLVRIVLNGLSGEIVVNGVTYNNAMTAFSNLSDKDIASVLTYVRNSWGNQYDAVDEATVASIRASVGGRTAPYSPQELLDLVQP
jgi:mono/diheme cytochrome c family protein